MRARQRSRMRVRVRRACGWEKRRCEKDRLLRAKREDAPHAHACECARVCVCECERARACACAHVHACWREHADERARVSTHGRASGALAARNVDFARLRPRRAHGGQGLLSRQAVR
eukprot:4867055-Pleurochrysis_carterae.AAC.1